jgi:hypothetical protein
VRRSSKTVFCLLACAAATAARAERIISEGDTWRFRNGFSFPGANWAATNYDDSVTGWFSFPSGFGYGDADDATNLADMQNGYAAFFTRKKFVVTNPAAVNRLTLGVDYDDGFVAFINGTEVARGNVAGTVTNTLLAAGNHEASRGEGPSNPNEKEFFAINPNVLVAGTNVIAVSGHNVSLTSSDASLIVEVYTNVTLVRGPFIQMPEHDKVTVVWRTEALTDSAVDFGLTPAYEGGTVSDAALVREHPIHIPGLVAGTNYFYRVRSGGVTLSAGNSLRTKAAPNQPFRFVVIGDFGQGTPGMSNIAARINARTDFDFKITVGDNIYGQTGAAGSNSDGAPGYYDPFWFKLYAPTMARAPTFVTLGNHDVDTANGQWSVDFFQMPTNGPPGQLEKNYSFQYGNAHCAVIDTEPFQDNQTTIMDAIKTWLSNDLAAATLPWKFVFLHRPPRTSVGGHDDQINVRTHLTPLFAQFGVQIVFQGHNHWYERINAINGVHYITTGAAGAGLYSIVNRKPYSAVLRNDVHSYTVVDINGTRLNLQQIDATGAPIDQFNVDIGHPFNIDGLLDDPAWLRADSGLKLYAAIRGVYLYVATQDAGEGGDNFIYINNVLSTNRPANWAKAGTVMQWNAFLADENDNAFQSWFGSTEAQRNEFPFFQSMTSGLNNNDPLGNGVLEGTIDLTNRFGTFPQQLYLAAAAFGTADAGALSAQVPAGNGDGNITSNEFLALNTRDIALDLPIANAGTNLNALVNTSITLNGTGSSAPSGAALTYSWTKLSGPPGAFTGTDTATPTYSPTNFVGASSNAVFRLIVNDGRFASDPSTMTVVVKNDSDRDGLTDEEELTGIDDPLTPANPNGHLTDPGNPDSDGDGMVDGDEALAGTDPNDPVSALRITHIGPASGTVRIEWPAVAGKTYFVEYRTEFTDMWFPLTNVTAATSAVTNAVDETTGAASKRLYRLRLSAP